MSYSIVINGQEHKIKECHNEENFTQAVEMFRLFDDSRINLEESRKALKNMDQKFQIRFYLADTIECIFDSYMFACLLGNYKLIVELGYDDGKWNLRPNEKYCYGTSTTITPFAAICQNFNLTTGENRKALELFLQFSDYDADQTDVFGNKSIPQGALDYISKNNLLLDDGVIIGNLLGEKFTLVEKNHTGDKFKFKLVDNTEKEDFIDSVITRINTNKYRFMIRHDVSIDDKIERCLIVTVINPMITIDKFYFENGNRIKFQSYDALPSSVEHDYIGYTLNLNIQGHKFSIPFGFEDGHDIIFKKFGEEPQKISNTNRTIAEEKEGEEGEEGEEGIYTSSEISNNKKIIRFGIDADIYEMDYFLELDEFKMGPDITVNRQGLIFSSESDQDISTNFEVTYQGLSSELIEIINDCFVFYKDHFKNC